MEIMPDLSLAPSAPASEMTPRLDYSNDRTLRIHGGSLRPRLVVITLAWVFGSVWYTTTSGSALTVFAKGLGASNFQFGLLAALPYIASLMAVPGSILIE